jgi:hypothetical protein
MGLLDTWSRRALQRRDEKAEFLGEQSGSVENTLKRELILEFATRPDIRRAYLATARFESQTEPSTVLGIVSARPDDQSLVVRVGEIFRRQFPKDAVLDVLFLSAEQEADLALVSRPFYGTSLPLNT